MTNIANNMDRKRNAFTLVELLVVVAIIALLISILLPSLNQARATARMVKCQAILKQFGVANQMYADENKNILPPGWAVHAMSKYRWFENVSWRQMLGIMEPRKEAPAQWLCPDAPEQEVNPTDHQTSRSRDPYASHWDHVYGSNCIGLRWVAEANGEQAAFFNRLKVESPSSAIVFVDATIHEFGNYHNINPDMPGTWATYGDTTPARGAMGHTVAYRHNNGAGLNGLHYDSHVSYYTAAEAYPASNTALKRLWLAYEP